MQTRRREDRRDAGGGRRTRGAVSDPPNSPQQTQFQYAWRWFSYHAKQRVNMLNYFLVGIGILANAYVVAISSKLYPVAGAIGLAGAFVSVCFLMLDVRNQALVGYAQAVLRKLEREYIFAGENKRSDDTFGIILVDESGGRNRGFAAVAGGRHKVFIPLIEGVSAAVFAAAAVWSFFIH
jgi:hypothetical protein